MNVIVWDATHAVRLHEGKQVIGSFSASFSPFPTAELDTPLLAKYGTGASKDVLPLDVPAPLDKRYAIFPERLVEVDGDLFEAIVSCYPSPSSRD